MQAITYIAMSEEQYNGLVKKIERLETIAFQKEIVPQLLTTADLKKYYSLTPYKIKNYEMEGRITNIGTPYKKEFRKQDIENAIS